MGLSTGAIASDSRLRFITVRPSQKARNFVDLSASTCKRIRCDCPAGNDRGGCDHPLERGRGALQPHDIAQQYQNQAPGSPHPAKMFTSSLLSAVQFFEEVERSYSAFPNLNFLQGLSLFFGEGSTGFGSPKLSLGICSTIGTT